MNVLRRFFCNEHIILVAIVLNTAIMFLGGFWPESTWFELSDSIFTLLFLMEAIVKISTDGWKKYWQDNWNRFDFIVVVIALPSLASPFFEHSMATNAVLALRSMRLFKSFKVIRFIPNIKKLLNGIKLAFRASLLVFAAGIVILLIFAILSSAIFGGMAPEYFGNPGISVYSIFRLFSIEGWYEMPDVIASNSTPGWGIFARIYFSILVFLGGMIGMSLITSIFVDTMAGDNNDEVLEKLDKIENQIKEIKETTENK